MSARNIQNFCIQFFKQIRKSVLIFFFENVFLRKKNLYFSSQIRKIVFFKNRIVLQHIYTLEAVNKPLLIVQVRSHRFIEASAIFPLLFRFAFQKSGALFNSSFISVFAGTSFSKRRRIGVEKRSFRMSLT